jgi:hypothetical protein
MMPGSHQVAAVTRMIGEPAVLLAHEVGAGNTAEMIMGNRAAVARAWSGRLLGTCSRLRGGSELGDVVVDQETPSV